MYGIKFYKLFLSTPSFSEFFRNSTLHGIDLTNIWRQGITNFKNTLVVIKSTIPIEVINEVFNGFLNQDGTFVFYEGKQKKKKMSNQCYGNLACKTCVGQKLIPDDKFHKSLELMIFYLTCPLCPLPLDKLLNYSIHFLYPTNSHLSPAIPTEKYSSTPMKANPASNAPKRT